MDTAVDRGTVRIVVVFIGLVVLACVGGIIGLSATETPIPQVLELTTATALGSFVTLLSSLRSPVQQADIVPPAPAVDNTKGI